MSDHREWQKKTAIRRAETVRKSLEEGGMPVSEMRIANVVAGYVDARPEQVLAWMRGGE